MAEAGKGSSPRPYSVPKEQYDKNWEQAFGKKDKHTDRQPQQKDVKI